LLDDTPFLAKDPNHAFSVADLMAWEKTHGRIPKGAFVALRTDMYKDWETNQERFKRSPFPAWAFETIKFLYEQRGRRRDRPRGDGHRHHRQDGVGDLHSCRRGPLPDRYHGQISTRCRPRARYRGDLAEGEEGLGFPARAFAILP